MVWPSGLGEGSIIEAGLKANGTRALVTVIYIDISVDSTITQNKAIFLVTNLYFN